MYWDYLQSWLLSLVPLGVRKLEPADFRRGISLRTLEDPKSTLSDVFEPLLVRFIQAADYLDDRDSLRSLLHQAAVWLFQGIDNTDENSKVENSRLEDINKLPEHLVEAVFTAWRKPIINLLRALPPSAHKSALHVAYPSLKADSSIEIEVFQRRVKEDVRADQGTLGGALAPLTGLKSLTIGTGRFTMCEPGHVDGLVHHVRGLVGLKRLELRNVSLLPEPPFHEEHLGELFNEEEVMQELHEIQPPTSPPTSPPVSTKVRMSVLAHLEILWMIIRDLIAALFGYFLPQWRGSTGHIHVTGSTSTEAVLGASLGHLRHLEQLTLSSVTLHDLEPILTHSGQLEALTSLDLSYTLDGHSSHSDGQLHTVLTNHLSSFSRLRRLNLVWNFIHSRSMPPLCSAMSSLSCLEDLDLTRSDIGAALGDLVASISFMKDLKHLKLRQTDLHDCIGGDAVAILCHGLKDIRLETLDLTWNKLNYHTFKNVADTGSILSSLRSLRVAYTLVNTRMKSPFPHINFEVLASCLGKLTSLQHLQIAGNRIEAAGHKCLSDSLAHLTCLTSISMGDLDFRDKKEAGEHLFCSVGKLSTLQRLSLKNTRLGDVEEEVPRLLTGISALTSLILKYTAFRDEVLGKLLSISNFSTLRELDAAQSSVRNRKYMTINGSVGLTESLSNLRGLTKLDLSWAWFNGLSYEFLKDNLAPMAQLKHLRLVSSFNKDDTTFLCDVIPKLASLEVVDLVYNHISEESWQVWLSRLERLPSLRHVLVDSDSMPDLKDCEFQIDHFRVHCIWGK